MNSLNPFNTPDIIQDGGIVEYVTFTSLVPRLQAQKCLAACHVLVSPQIPNPDGRPFFGSPTKLFDYIAIGKGIVARNLDQIGQALRDGESAILTAAGEYCEPCPRDLPIGEKRDSAKPSRQSTSAGGRVKIQVGKSRGSAAGRRYKAVGSDRLKLARG